MMLNVLSQRSFALLPDKKGMRDHPDTVDDLFRLAIRFAQRCPHKFFCEPVCATLFEGAIHGLELDHSDANKSVSKFIGETIDIVKRKKNGNLSMHLQQYTSQLVGAEQLVLKYGDQVVWHSINAALFHLSHPLRREMAEILFALGQLSKLKLNEWLNLAIQNLPHDSGLSPTSQQLAAFRDEVLKAEKPHEVMNHIRDLSKYYF
uniref:Uncharacterized protein n=1 Tax=Ditylenchus dipsaci TaxID=166011 RepID=A0A915DNM6_9BILA